MPTSTEDFNVISCVVAINTRVESNKSFKQEDLSCNKLSKKRLNLLNEKFYAA